MDNKLINHISNHISLTDDETTHLLSKVSLPILIYYIFSCAQIASSLFTISINLKLIHMSKHLPFLILLFSFLMQYQFTVTQS